MYIKVEPAEFFMYRVMIMFNLDKPDPEDEPARDYMDEWELEPKYRYPVELEGDQMETWQFGGCYLGKHLGHLGEIQRRHVEVELLTAEIERLLNEPDHAVAIPDSQREQALVQLVQGFHQDSSFRTSEAGELEAVLDAEAVRGAAKELIANPS